MSFYARALGMGFLVCLPFSAWGSFHLWTVSEVFSNEDGSVQFVELFTGADGQTEMDGRVLTANSDGLVVMFTLDQDLAAPTANRRLLFATPGFADLSGGVTPDFTIPPGFFDPEAVSITVDFAGVDNFGFGAATLPTDGVSSLVVGAGVQINSPTNYAGQSGSVEPVPLFADGFEDLDCGILGNGCFLMTFGATPEPVSDAIAEEPILTHVDIYLMVDRSGSMSAENTALRNAFAILANTVTCPPNGGGTPGSCLPDPWWGTAGVGYTGANGMPYANFSDLTSNRNAPGPLINPTEPPGCCDETALLAMHSTITGDGSADAGCTVMDPYVARTDCSGSEAGATGFGYPCFRAEARSVITLVTDEAPSATFNCPDINLLGPTAQNAGVLITGIDASNGVAAVQTDLQTLANTSGALDGQNNPIVAVGSDSAATTAFQTILQTLTTVPMDVTAVVVDDPGDGVDVVAEFVDHVQTEQLGTAVCSDGLAEADTDMDTFADTYISVAPGTPLCFRLVLKNNTTVNATGSDQFFRGSLEIRGDGFLRSESLLFLVPAANP